MKKWSVTIKGSHDKQTHEIAVEYGNPIDSWGWFGAEKIRVSHHMHGETNKLVWNRLVKLADEMCEYMNNNHPNGAYFSTPEATP
jgi:hypothetical protein